MTNTEIKEEMKAWTVYGIIEGEQYFQDAFDDARKYLGLTEKEVEFLLVEGFVKECFEAVEAEQII